MKKSITLAIYFLLCIVRLSAQSNTGALGGEATGTGGSVSFTAGEVFYTYKTGATGSSTDGVQQNFVPIISSFTPASGAPGTLVTITGTDLNGLSSFTIGGVSAVVVSNTGETLVGMVMPGAATGTVAVSTPGGSATSAGTFTVQNTPFPIAQQGTKLVASNVLLSPSQGWSVALSADGKTALVSGYFDNNGAGATWAYTRTGNTWTQQAKLIGTGNTGNAWQGFSVALSADGNTAIVGGAVDASGKGAVWIFTRSGSTWAQQGTKLVASDRVGNAWFGKSVSLSADGNTALVGGYNDNANAGAAWIFTRSGTTWTQEGTKLVGTGAIGAAQQGTYVSLSADGTIAAIGGAGDDSNKGATWIFTRSGSTWSQQGNKLVGTGAVGASKQGQSVALSADATTLLIGGINATSNVSNAWVYTRSGSTWTQQGTTLVGSDAIGTAANGTSVSLSADGNTAMMGSVSDNGNRGAAWVFTRSGNTYTQKGRKLEAIGTVGTTLYMGRSVALSADGTNMLVGADGDATSQGAAWSYAIGVTYDGNGNTGGTVPVSQLETIGSSVTLATNSGALVKTDNIFAGWNTLVDGTGTSYTEAAAITFDGSLPLFAQWTLNYTITFNANGGTGSMANQDIAEGATEALIANTFTLAGYTFVGWNTAADGTGTYYADQAAYTMGSDNVTLYAQWGVQISVLTTSPTVNAIVAPNDANITLVFNDNVDATSVTASSVKISGNQGLPLSFASPTVTAATVALAPNRSFFPGEVITTTLTTNVSSSTGGTLEAPYSYRFTAAVAAASPGTFPNGQNIITTAASGATSVSTADLDGDGDLDVLSASLNDDKIAWYANDGSGNFGAQQIITTSADFAVSVSAADIDGDGDLDVLSASAQDNKIAWYENDGSGSFGAQKIITIAAITARSVSTADLDGDGDLDVLSASSTDNKIAWYANDGSGNFGEQQIITTAAVYASSVTSADLDGDGDLDVLSASRNDDKIAWYANDGSGSFGAQQIITTVADGAVSVSTADIDGDGDLDVLSASLFDDKIAWYTNNGSGSFGPQQIITTAADEAVSVSTADLDGDGDLDVLSASNGVIAWYVNDGSGAFGVQQIITTAVNLPAIVSTADLDGDGDVDVLSASINDDKIAWYENAAPTYTITFNANGGVGTMANQLIAAGTTAALTANAFTRAGYTFAGWATTNNGTVAYANSASYTMGAADVTLFAMWTATSSSNGAVTQLRPIQCGKTLSYLTSAIQASPRVGATEYTFEVTRDDNSVVNTIVTSNYYFFPATLITNGLVYGKSYSIKVKAKIGGTYTAYGNTCIVTAPTEPAQNTITKIRPIQCGKTLNYITDAIQASPVYKAVRYEFEVNNGALTVVIPSKNYYFRLSQFPGGGVFNTAYTIRVRSSNAPAPAAFTAWGDYCVVSTPNPIARLSETNASDSIFTAKAFPNPFASHFSLDIESSSDALVELKVYDMLGRQLEVREATVSELRVQEVGRNYPSGVYNVVVSQGDKVKSLRMVKR